MTTYYTIEDIKAANARRGHHFFDADTLRFFGARLSKVFPVDGDGAVFVHSIKHDRLPRQYRVGWCRADGSIGQADDDRGIYDLRGLPTLKNAIAYAGELAFLYNRGLRPVDWAECSAHDHGGIPHGVACHACCPCRSCTLARMRSTH